MGDDYEEYVQKSVDAGFQKLLAEDELVYVDGVLVRGGGFAVPKDEAETRGISPFEGPNSLVDDRKVPRVEYAYVPQLSVLSVPLKALLVG